jgi:hypothetical protein
MVMFCSVCLVEYEEDEKHLTHCPICETLLVSSAFQDEIFDDDDDDDDDDGFGDFDADDLDSESI